ncbi:UDP-2,3-diacylglucosamine diphosphatase [Parasalinivibrio latis]|uniref:UDP-2,3-diacylglucosamine diphosphatase n=1 Tax=Parasalinivibrio latis TaxID=2952610 RepID=UPI0030E580E9
MTTLFISDLHLSADRPDIAACFLHFMETEARQCEALYVLGDLFESWIGDDDDTPFHRQVIQAFRNLTASGVPCYFIHGNRDFLIGKRFARESGIQLMDEHSVIDLYGTPALILHGDTLCTRDEGYQAYRRKVHNKFIQWLYFRLPLSARRNIGNKLRSKSSEENQHKSYEIMDVTPEEVDTQFARHQVPLMIHGHTHRPAVHETGNDGKTLTRIVLGDWYEHGSVLVCTPQGQTLESRPFTTKA